MKKLILFFAITALAFGQKTDHGFTAASSGAEYDMSTAAKVRIIVGTSAPSSGACDASNEAGSLYVQTGDPASVATRVSVCAKDGASSWGWYPISHKTGTTAPATCAVGELFFDTDATAGSNWFGCTASNTWTLLGGGSGGGFTWAHAIGAQEAISGSSSEYCGFSVSSTTCNGTQDTYSRVNIAPKTGTMQNFRLYANAAASGSNMSCSVQHYYSSSWHTTSIVVAPVTGSGLQVVSDTSNTESVTAGDLVQFKCDNTANSSPQYVISWSIEIN